MNEIQQKLKLIDQQINRPGFHKVIINTCPLFFAAAGLITGILTQNTAHLSIKIWVIFLSLAAITVTFLIAQKNLYL